MTAAHSSTVGQPCLFLLKEQYRKRVGSIVGLGPPKWKSYKIAGKITIFSK